MFSKANFVACIGNVESTCGKKEDITNLETFDIWSWRRMERRFEFTSKLE